MTRVYFDASVIVSLFINDDMSDRAESYVRDTSNTACVSDFAAAEFASALGVRIRMNLLSRDDAREAFAQFDGWKSGETIRMQTTAADVSMAESYLRRLDLRLRTPDALNIALAARIGAPLATFDIRMAESATILGMVLAQP